MNEQVFKNRTKRFALEIIRLVEMLPANMMGSVIGRQLLRCGTSVGANYRSVCRARSLADMIAKLRIVEEECDETLYWLELLEESGMMNPDVLVSYKREGHEITAMIVSSIKTMQRKTVRKNGPAAEGN